MACLFGHKWDGCKCTKCGTTRDEGHDWDLCTGKCKRCGATQPEQHDWDGCTCKRCGQTRDESHDWNGCKCRICGKSRGAQHTYVPVDGACLEKCSICGIEHEKHNYEMVPVEGDERICGKNVCTRCGAEEDVEHDFQYAGSRTVLRCSVCGLERIKPHAHDFYDHRCRECGMFDNTVKTVGDFTLSRSRSGNDLVGYGGRGVKDVVLPEGIRKIWTNDFDTLSHNDDIETVRFPSALRSTGMHTFAWCKNLREVCMNEGLVSIDQGAFEGCASLVKINFPSTLKTIDYAAFSGCTSLAEIELPDGLESIGIGPFMGCGKLVIKCHANTEAHRYAVEQGIPMILMEDGAPSTPRKEYMLREATEAENGGRTIRHIVCICYDEPGINALKPEMQDFIIKAEQQRGNIITGTSRITVDSFYDNNNLEEPSMIRQKLHQIYSQVYDQSAMFELADQTVVREVQQKDGHTLVKYFVLYE